MKYQLEYSRDLIADESFVIKETNERISGLSFYVRFGTVFEGDQPSEQKVEVAESLYCLSDLLKVSYSKETQEFDFLLHDGYTDGYEVVSYYICVGNLVLEPKECSKLDFNHIIQVYGDKFSTDNALQCCSYGIHELKDDAVVSESVQQVQTEQPLFVRHLENMVNQSKKKVDSIPRSGSMAINFRSECLHFMQRIDAAENKKTWYISQSNVSEKMSEVMEWYMYLINLYEQYYAFLSQEGVYVQN
jgi:hypothetical protein